MTVWNTSVFEDDILDHNTTDECVPLKKSYVLGLSLFPAFAAMENLVFLFAIILHRTTLKLNNVYRYVASALAANLLISVLAFYHFLNYHYGFEPHQPNSWWAFRKGMQLALSLVLCGNIGLLIYGIHDSTYIVGRVSVSSPPTHNRSPSYRRKKANGLILIVWALPTLYGLLAMTPWNCNSGQCTCTLSYKSGKPICSGDLCSQLYTPMARSYLLVVVFLWVLECLGLLGLMLKSVISSIHAEKKSFKTMNCCQVFVEIMSKNKIVFVLFSLFVCCTAPVMVSFALDLSMPDISFNHDIVNFMIPLPLLYCFVSPFLLINRLSGVRSALQLTLSFSCANRNKKKKSGPKKATPRPTSISISEFPKSTSV